MREFSPYLHCCLMSCDDGHGYGAGHLSDAGRRRCRSRSRRSRRVRAGRSRAGAVHGVPGGDGRRPRRGGRVGRSEQPAREQGLRRGAGRRAATSRALVRFPLPSGRAGGLRARVGAAARCTRTRGPRAPGWRPCGWRRLVGERRSTGATSPRRPEARSRRGRRDGYMAWNVTSQVRAMLGGAQPRLALRDPAEGTDLAGGHGFYSREKGESPPRAGDPLRGAADRRAGAAGAAGRRRGDVRPGRDAEHAGDERPRRSASGTAW